MNLFFAPFELKSLSDEGVFAGHASVTGNVDDGNDLIEPGAYELVKNSAGKLPVLWMHKADEPVAVADVFEDRKGLAFTGRLVMADELARKAYAHLKAGSVRGMSIGYSLLKHRMQNGVRHLEKIRVHEISLVSTPMNRLAGVDMVKAQKTLADVPTLRDFTDGLHTGIFIKTSKRKAAAMAKAWWPHVTDSELDEQAALEEEIERALQFKLN